MDIQIFPAGEPVTFYFWAGVYQRRRGDTIFQRLETVNWGMSGEDPMPTIEETTAEAESVIQERWNEPDDGPFTEWTRTLWNCKYIVHQPPEDE